MPGAPDSFLAYVMLAAAVTLTPGPNWALVIRTALESDAAAGIRATTGIAVALAVWAVASAVGVAAVVRASPDAFRVLQIAGGLWLVYLGTRGLRSRVASVPADGSTSPRRQDFHAGLVTNLLNPMAGAFYLAALPGFVPPGAGAPLVVLLLAAIHIAMVVTWLSTCSVLVARGTSVFARPAVRLLLQRASAVVLIGFGVRIIAGVALDW